MLNFSSFTSINNSAKYNLTIKPFINDTITVKLEFKRLKCSSTMRVFRFDFGKIQVTLSYKTDASLIIIKTQEAMIPYLYMLIINPLDHLYNSIVESNSECGICFCFLQKNGDFVTSILGCYHGYLLNEMDQVFIFETLWVKRKFLLLMIIDALTQNLIFFRGNQLIVLENGAGKIEPIMIFTKRECIFKILWKIVAEEKERIVISSPLLECPICLDRKVIFSVFRCGHSYCNDCYLTAAKSLRRKCFICKSIIKNV